MKRIISKKQYTLLFHRPFSPDCGWLSVTGQQTKPMRLSDGMPGIMISSSLSDVTTTEKEILHRKCMRSEQASSNWMEPAMIILVFWMGISHLITTVLNGFFPTSDRFPACTALMPKVSSGTTIRSRALLEIVSDRWGGYFRFFDASVSSKLNWFLSGMAVRTLLLRLLLSWKDGRFNHFLR